MTPQKDSMLEAAEYATKVRAREARKARLGLARNRNRPAIRVGDLVKVHGYLGEVARTLPARIVYTTGCPGERIFYKYSSQIEKRPRTCWILEQ
jgi:hypothetical protein